MKERRHVGRLPKQREKHRKNEKDKEIKLILNEDQFKIYKTYQEQSKDKKRAAFKVRNNN